MSTPVRGVGLAGNLAGSPCGLTVRGGGALWESRRRHDNPHFLGSLVIHLWGDAGRGLGRFALVSGGSGALATGLEWGCGLATGTSRAAWKAFN